jgi:hypothetical protein
MTRKKARANGADSLPLRALRSQESAELPDAFSRNEHPERLGGIR